VSAADITASANSLVAVVVFILNQGAQVRQERWQARLAKVSNQTQAALYGGSARGYQMLLAPSAAWQSREQPGRPAAKPYVYEAARVGV
jgi:hypothetical protein